MKTIHHQETVKAKGKIKKGWFGGWSSQEGESDQGRLVGKEEKEQFEKLMESFSDQNLQPARFYIDRLAYE